MSSAGAGSSRRGRGKSIWSGLGGLAARAASIGEISANESSTSSSSLIEYLPMSPSKLSLTSCCSAVTLASSGSLLAAARTSSPWTLASLKSPNSAPFMTSIPFNHSNS